MKPVSFDVEGYAAAMAAPCEFEQDARLLATVKVVATECAGLVNDPSVGPEIAAPFSFLTKSVEGPYHQNYPTDYSEQAEAYLKPKGYGGELGVERAIHVLHASRVLHDRRNDWQVPHYGLTARKTENIPYGPWPQIVAITVEKPQLAKRVFERRWGMFESKRIRAAFILIAKAAEITQEDVAIIQNNLDSWRSAR